MFCQIYSIQGVYDEHATFPLGFQYGFKYLLCRLRSITAHRDHFVQHLYVCVSVCLSGSHTRIAMFRKWHMHSSECCHYANMMLPSKHKLHNENCWKTKHVQHESPSIKFVWVKHLFTFGSKGSNSHEACLTVHHCAHLLWILIVYLDMWSVNRGGERKIKAISQWNVNIINTSET